MLLLIEHLPEDSATWKARRGDPWSEQTHILAYLADHLVFMRAEAQGEGGMKPEQLPRPGGESIEDRRAATRSVRDHLMAKLEQPGEA